MKPMGAASSRTVVTAWHQQKHASNGILTRIQKITRELEGIQTQLHSQLAESTDGRRTFADAEGAQVLRQLKAELDQLRRVLWFYLEGAAEPCGAEPNHDQQAANRQRTELLSALSPQPAAPVETSSFFDRLNVVIDTYMREKEPVAHRKPGKPVGN